MPKTPEEQLLPERKVLTTDVPFWVAERIRKLAREEKRSLARQLEIIVTDYVEENL